MRKTVSALLALFMIFAVLPIISVTAESNYPDPATLNGTENICLTYTFAPKLQGGSRHTAESLKPYVAYVDKNGKAVDTFMDGFLFLPCVQEAPSGGGLHSSGNYAVASDWQAYVDDLFAENYNVNALEAAAENVSKELDREVKCKVFLTVLFPYRSAGKNFGDLGSGPLNFGVLEDREKAIKWCIDEQVKRFNEAGYKHLELVGFYWLRETITDEANPDWTTLHEQATVRYAVDYSHELGYKAIWIPYYFAQSWNKWKDYGFDVANLQPNLMFPQSWETVDENFLSTRMPEATKRMATYGMGMEIEMDEQVFSTKYDRYQAYLKYGVETGLMNSVKMYYQGGAPGILYYASKSDNQFSRLIYDQTYKYAKGTLTVEDIVSPGEYDDSGWEWISRGKSYTATAPYTGDGSMGYHKISGKELTDGIYGSESFGTEWHGFYQPYAVNGKFEITVDLGKTYSGIQHFSLEFEDLSSAGIGLPSDVEIYISDDGKNFKKITTAKVEIEPIILPRANATLTTPVSARYVKAVFGRANSSRVFIFCSEFGIGRKEGYQVNIGDINGDGNVNARDYGLLKRHCLGTYVLTEEELAAADIDGNGSITARDYGLLKRAVLGTYTI